MKLVKREPDEGHEMNMTPMIDVVFQLLIFFMLVSEMSQTEKVDLVLPRASEATPDEGQPGRHTINIKEGGKIYLGNTEVTLDELDGILKGESGLYTKAGSDGKISEKPILIRADQDAHFEHVQKIMGKCVKHGIYKISFGAMASSTERNAAMKEGGS